MFQTCKFFRGHSVLNANICFPRVSDSIFSFRMDQIQCEFVAQFNIMCPCQLNTMSTMCTCLGKVFLFNLICSHFVSMCCSVVDVLVVTPRQIYSSIIWNLSSRVVSPNVWLLQWTTVHACYEQEHTCTFACIQPYQPFHFFFYCNDIFKVGYT